MIHRRLSPSVEGHALVGLSTNDMVFLTYRLQTCSWRLCLEVTARIHFLQLRGGCLVLCRPCAEGAFQPPLSYLDLPIKLQNEHSLIGGLKLLIGHLRHIP